MITLVKINRPIKFYGLSPKYFGIFVLAIALSLIAGVFLQLNPLVIVGVVMIVILLSKRFLKKFNMEHKSGNPDYLTGLRVKRVTPFKIVDKHRIFKTLMSK